MNKVLLGLLLTVLIGQQLIFARTDYHSGYYYVDNDAFYDPAFLHNSTEFVLVDGAYMSSIWAYGTSKVTINGGHVVRDVRADSNSEIIMAGGNIRGLYAYQTSHVEMSGGVISEILASGYDSQIDFSAGTVGEAIRVLNNGRIDIYGTSFTVYSEDHVDGVQLLDGENLLEYASFATYTNGYNYHLCQIVGTLQDGSSIDNIVQINNIGPWEGPANVYVHIIPEPATLSLLACGALCLRKKKEV